MKILIPLFSPPTGSWGSLTRILAIGETAKTMGHEIAFCASGYLADRLIKNGYKVYLTPESTMFGLPKFISKLIEARSQNNSIPVKPGKSIGNIWFVLMITGMTKFKFLEKLVKAELVAAEDFHPDLLFTEIDPGAFMLSKITGVPISCTYASIMKIGIGTFAYKKLFNSMNKILKNYGKNQFDLVELFQGNKTLKIIPSIPELEESIPSTPDYIFSGSLLQSFRTPDDQLYTVEKGKRYIFVYAGTGSITQNKLSHVLPELFPKDSDTICLVGGSQCVEKEKRIGNVIFRPFFDAESIMPHCDWVICHGGHNTIIQALINRVPLIIFPGPIFERRFNARMVHKSGAGIFGELPDFNTIWLKKIIDNREPYANKAKELGEKILSYNGAETAIKAMEIFCSKKK